MTIKPVHMLIILALVLLGMMMYLYSPQVKPPVLVSRMDPPKIQIEEEYQNLGEVAEGIEIPLVFRINNVGGEALVIKNVTTNCSCLLLNLRNNYVEPGKSSDMEVVLDTSMLHGPLTKTIDIFTNDPKLPRKTIHILAEVLPSAPSMDKLLKGKIKSLKTSLSSGSFDLDMSDPHAGMNDVMRTKIFTGQCANCHVEQGKGKTGSDLYQADCAMCHGQNGEGGLGPALVPGNYHDQDYANRAQKIVRYGSDYTLSMPGFLKEAGGPLTDGEINSIVQYLQNKSDQARFQPSEIPGG